VKRFRARVRPVLAFYGAVVGRALGPLAGCAVLALFQAGVQIPIVITVRRLFDTRLPAGDVAGVMSSGALIFALSLLSGVLGLAGRAGVLLASKRAIARLRGEVVERFLTYPRSFFTRPDLSRWHAAAVQDSEKLDVSVNALFAQLVPSALVLAALSGVLFWMSPRLFAVTLASVPFFAVAFRLGGRALAGATARFRAAMQAFSGATLFLLQRMDLVRLQSAAEVERARQQRVIDDLRRLSGAMAWIRAAHNTAQELIMIAAGVSLHCAGASAVARGRLTLGELLAFFSALALARNHVTAVLSALPDIAEGGPAIRGLRRLTRARPSPYHGTERVDATGRVSLRGVAFGFGARPLLDGIDLDLAPGRVTVVTGANGAGKTALSDVILGFYRPHAGQIEADGMPFDRLDLDGFRRNIGVVRQEPAFLNGSLRENIFYGTGEVEPDALAEAVAAARADRLFAALPAGFETPLGENGARLSGGQRQQVALVRALLRRPRLLILDEPTNHLDGDTVEALLRGLRALAARPAVLILTHAPEAVAAADDVFVLGPDGRLRRPS
jgi:ABC-type bacteriocin/lantibiotic exporter with double-glycine peptidase domain